MSKTALPPRHRPPSSRLQGDPPGSFRPSRHEPTLRERFEAARRHLLMARLAAFSDTGADRIQREIVRARYEIHRAVLSCAASSGRARAPAGTGARRRLERVQAVSRRVESDLQDAVLRIEARRRDPLR